MTNPDYLQPVEDGLPVWPAGKWAAEKLDYLERYIDVFETSMRNKWRCRCYIDLFAGPGKNVVKGKGQVILGSPLIALTTKHPFTNYFFVESEPERADALRTRCTASPYVDPGRIRVIEGDCNVVVDTITEETARAAGQWSCLNLAFLDPEGLDLKWQTVEKLASMKHMDLIIHFPIMGLWRTLRGYSEMEPPTLAEEFFGRAEWRDAYSHYLARRGRLSRLLLDLYEQKLTNLGYVVTLGEATGDEVLIRSTKRRPLYYLVFASKHPLGKEFWRSVSSRDVWGQRRLF